MAGSRMPGPIGTSGLPQALDDGTMTRALSPLPSPIGIFPPSDGTRSNKDMRADQIRMAQNKDYLQKANVKAFIGAIAAAEGGDYNLKFGGVKGKKTTSGNFQITRRTLGRVLTVRLQPPACTRSTRVLGMKWAPKWGYPIFHQRPKIYSPLKSFAPSILSTI